MVIFPWPITSCILNQVVDILADGNNTSDDYATSVNINIPDDGRVDATRPQSQRQYRWDRADLTQYESLCSGMLDQLQLLTEARLRLY